MAVQNKVKYDSVANRQSQGANGFIEIDSTSPALDADDRLMYIEAEGGDVTFSFTNETPKGIQSSAAYTLKDGKSRLGYFKDIDVEAGGGILVCYFAE